MTDPHRADEGAKAMRPEETMTTRLTCHAPHHVITVSGAHVTCGTFLGYVPGQALFVETAVRAPDEPEVSSDVWTKCTNKGCKAWNRFRVVREAAA